MGKHPNLEKKLAAKKTAADAREAKKRGKRTAASTGPHRTEGLGAGPSGSARLSGTSTA